MSVREGSQRERGLGPRRKRGALSLGPATRADRLDASREGAGTGRALGGLSEERA